MNETFQQKLSEAITNGVKSEVERLFDEHKERIVAGIVLKLQKQMDVETIGEKLVTTVLSS